MGMVKITTPTMLIRSSGEVQIRCSVQCTTVHPSVTLILPQDTDHTH